MRRHILLKSAAQALICLRGWERYLHGAVGLCLVSFGQWFGWLMVAAMALGLLAAWRDKYERLTRTTDIHPNGL